MPAKKRTAKKTRKKATLPTMTEQKNGAEELSPAAWNKVIVLVGALLVIGILAGVGNLVTNLQSADSLQYSPSWGANAEPSGAAKHTESEVKDLVYAAMEYYKTGGSIEYAAYDQNTGKWNIRFVAVKATGQTVDFDVVVDDETLSIDSMKYNMPIPDLSPKNIEPGNDPVLGRETAAVTLAMYSDFDCGFCKQGYDTVKQLKEEYGDKLRLVFKNFLPNSQSGTSMTAEAGECAHEQGKFWEFADKLFAGEDMAARTVRNTAEELGLDIDKFDYCMNTQFYANEVAADNLEAIQVGASGSPTFFVNGRIVRGAQPIEEFRDLIEEELA
ncbi:MAG: thioredoxin domain-containing protein [Candidatus Diapherotrites archaeon]|nr:thioredoxin domain-containing protein [Candidatus Diapherotrites archaeon]